MSYKHTLRKIEKIGKTRPGEWIVKSTVNLNEDHLRVLEIKHFIECEPIAGNQIIMRISEAGILFLHDKILSDSVIKIIKSISTWIAGIIGIIIGSAGTLAVQKLIEKLWQ